METNSEVIVVANACTDATIQVARETTSDHAGLPTEVIDTKRRGKKLALNIGLEAARGEVVVCIDGDLVVAHGAITRMVEDLNRPGVRLAGCQVAPAIHETWTDIRPAPSIDLLAFAKRQVTHPHKSVRGDMVGYHRSVLPSGYPAGAAPDDAWVSAHVGSRFGLDAIHVNERIGVIYLPPMTLKDLTSQIGRYRMSEGLVTREHPDLAEYYRELREHWKAVDGDDLQARWQASAEDMGLNFEKWKARYDQLLRAADRYATDRRRLPRVDRWTSTATTKRPPITALPKVPALTNS